MLVNNEFSSSTLKHVLHTLCHHSAAAHQQCLYPVRCSSFPGLLPSLHLSFHYTHLLLQLESNSNLWCHRSLQGRERSNLKGSRRCSTQCVANYHRAARRSVGAVEKSSYSRSLLNLTVSRRAARGIFLFGVFCSACCHCVVEEEEEEVV